MYRTLQQKNARSSITEGQAAKIYENSAQDRQMRKNFFLKKRKNDKIFAKKSRFRKIFSNCEFANYYRGVRGR